MGSAYDLSRRRFTTRSIGVNLGLVLGIALAVFMWVRVANLLTAKAPTASPLAQQPVSIVWGDHVFSSRAQLASWLRANHINVTVWLRQHPDAVRIIDGRPLPDATSTRSASRSHVTVRTTAATKTAEKRAAAAASPEVDGRPSKGSTLGGVGIDLLVALAFLLVALTVAPASAWRLVPRRMRGSAEERIYTAAGAAGILFGLLFGGIFP